MCSPRSTMWPTSQTLSTARWAGGVDDGDDDGGDDDGGDDDGGDDDDGGGDNSVPT